MSDIKILVSGCGITYSKQRVKTWPNILQLAGCGIIDVGGPAVSNQWIVNKTFLGLQQHSDIKKVIVQLTGLGKLDVDVDQQRIEQLVATDPLRNFVIDKNFQVLSGDQIQEIGTWPSSSSDHHESKKQWIKWLFSPNLEKEDLYCKLLLLDCYCQHHQIELHVYQGYEIDWAVDQLNNIQHMIKNVGTSLYSDYLQSPLYQYHDFENKNSVPCLAYQIELAQIIGKTLPQNIQNNLIKFKLAYDRN